MVALHACGAASDFAMGQAMARGAPFVVCPCCCVGKLAQHPKGKRPQGNGDAKGEGGGSSEGWNNGKSWVEAAPGGTEGKEGCGSPPVELLELPRSPWLCKQRVDAATFCALARRAERPDKLGRRCKGVMELDRCAAVAGHRVARKHGGSGRVYAFGEEVCENDVFCGVLPCELCNRTHGRCDLP